jgi:hypothetical protein
MEASPSQGCDFRTDPLTGTGSAVRDWDARVHQHETLGGCF